MEVIVKWAKGAPNLLDDWWPCKRPHNYKHLLTRWPSFPQIWHWTRGWALPSFFCLKPPQSCLFDGKASFFCKKSRTFQVDESEEMFLELLKFFDSWVTKPNYISLNLIEPLIGLFLTIEPPFLRHQLTLKIFKCDNVLTHEQCHRRHKRIVRKINTPKCIEHKILLKKCFINSYKIVSNGA